MHISLGNILRNGIAGLRGMNILNFISVQLLSELAKIIYTTTSRPSELLILGIAIHYVNIYDV